MLIKEFFERLSDWQIRRPWVFLVVLSALTAIFGVLALRLELRTRYDSLLPDSQPSVLELRRVEKRTSNAQTATIVLEGKNRDALRSLGDAIVPALLSLGPDVVSSAEDGMQQARAFLMPRAGLFLDKKELAQLRDDLSALWDYEVAKASDQLVDDAGPPVTIDEIERRFQSKASVQGASDRGEIKSNGYYERADGSALVVVARSSVPGGDLEKTGPALKRIQDTVASVKASRPEFAAVRVSYAGDMPQGFLQYDSIRKDLFNVGATGIGLILLSVLLYFMNLRALFVMGTTIGYALVWTFGVTQIAIGHLSVATGFLISIVAGNGINVGIMYQSRYFEERANGVPIAQAVKTSVKSIWAPTLIAGLSAAAAYGSLFITDFRAFRQFGFIAASGMLICWLVTTLMVPPLLVLVDGYRPLASSHARERDRSGLMGLLERSSMAYGRLFAWIVPKMPVSLFAVGALLAVGGAVASIGYIRRDPMDYDLRSAENDPEDNAEIQHAWDVTHELLGGTHEGMVVLADTPEDAHQLQKKLQADWDRAPEKAKPFASVHSLWDLVPDDQEAKIPMLREIRDRFDKAERRGVLTESRLGKLKEYVPPRDVRPFGLADLPDAVVRPFTEKDGTRGRLVVIEPEPSESNDLRYLLRYSDSFRETRLPSGKIVRGSGRAVVFADVLKTVVSDAPKAAALSLLFTASAVILTFRRGGRHAASVLFSLLLGVGALVVVLYFAKVKINFLNFVALPITCGIGVDYAVNVMMRYRQEKNRDILSVLRTTGGAVVLCSLTTILGYLALLGSHNRAIRSLGLIAVIGEVTCLLAAVTVLPAIWFVMERRRRVPVEAH